MNSARKNLGLKGAATTLVLCSDPTSIVAIQATNVGLQIIPSSSRVSARMLLLTPRMIRQAYSQAMAEPTIRLSFALEALTLNQLVTFIVLYVLLLLPPPRNKGCDKVCTLCAHQGLALPCILNDVGDYR